MKTNMEYTHRMLLIGKDVWRRYTQGETISHIADSIGVAREVVRTITQYTTEDMYKDVLRGEESVSLKKPDVSYPNQSPKDRKRSKRSRSSHLSEVHKNRSAKSKAIIEQIVNDSFNQDGIRKGNGTLHINAIATKAKMHKETVRKYLKELGEI